MRNVVTQCILSITLGCVLKSGALILGRPICEILPVQGHCCCKNFGCKHCSSFVDQYWSLDNFSVPRSLMVSRSLIVPWLFWALNQFICSRSMLCSLISVLISWPVTCLFLMIFIEGPEVHTSAILMLHQWIPCRSLPRWSERFGSDWSKEQVRFSFATVWPLTY